MSLISNNLYFCYDVYRINSYKSQLNSKDCIMPTIPERVYESLKSIEIGTILKKQEIVTKVKSLFPDTSSSSITPQDGCYNIINIGRSEKPLFEWIKNGHYKYLGKKYKYNGIITHKRQGSNTIEKVGYWTNGIKTITKEIINLQIFHTEIFYPDEIDNNEQIVNEGAKKRIFVNRYERDPKTRKKCIENYGCKCTICKFDFEKIYGKIGKDFIHVHHLKPLSETDEEHEVNPIQDLRPVCPNCHAMLHKKIPSYSIEEIINFIDKKNL